MAITPIILDLDASYAAATPTAQTPKFFSSVLTGNGKNKVGLLNADLLPHNTTRHRIDAVLRKSVVTEDGITTTLVPVSPETRGVIEHITSQSQYGHITVAAPDALDAFEITFPVNTGLAPLYLDAEPVAVALIEDTTGPAKLRELVIQYQLKITQSVSTSAAPVATTRAHVQYTCDPIADVAEMIQSYLNLLGISNTPDLDGLDEWFQNYNVHDRIAALAEVWAEDGIAERINTQITEMAGMLVNPKNPSANPNDLVTLERLASQLRYLENYPVTLEAYKAINRHIVATLPNEIALQLSKQNLNLLVNHTLDELEAKKPTLVRPTAPKVPAALDPRLSQQQLAAVTTDEPLAMTQAGAGTGKSHTIDQRIHYLIACGVEPEDITVLSFTNAAADNITTRNPRVGSMTIARMLIDIYGANHPTHQLSSAETLANSLEIYAAGDEVAQRLHYWLLEVSKTKAGAFTNLNNLVEKHQERIVELLDMVKQTTLELQIVMCYQRIDSMIEPAHVRSKYLIIDEVQDNSLFEFIYLLKYVSKHEQSLFIVGDASQTLFEFRAANPRALNTLESSGVFATYKLTTNYRSTQPILDFANVVLKGLSTNQFANIQLQANSLDATTEQTFTEAVNVDYRHLPKVSSFVTDELAGILDTTICRDYVDPCLARGEQVAFLAASRREVAIMENILKRRYPDKQIGSLVSERIFASDVFSSYIREYWNEVLQVDPSKAPFVISSGVQQNLNKLVRGHVSDAAEKAIMRNISDWWVNNDQTIRGWIGLVNQGRMSHAAYFDMLRENLLNYEIARNQQRMNVLKQRNQERKRANAESKPDLVVSTIHGAKGLEFDHVVLTYQDDPQMAQDKRRLYYVALTRACKSEYILAYGKSAKPPIQTNYERIVAALQDRDKAVTNAISTVAVADPDVLVVAEGAAPIAETSDAQPPEVAVPMTAESDTELTENTTTGPDAPGPAVLPGPAH